MCAYPGGPLSFKKELIVILNWKAKALLLININIICGGYIDMLFMDTWTWEPENRREVEKRWSESKYPEELKVVGEWLDLTGNRMFVLYEVDDPKAMLAVNDMWLDIAKVDSVPVMEAKEVAKIYAEKMG
jgi:hypothetical protein